MLIVKRKKKRTEGFSAETNDTAVTFNKSTVVLTVNHGRKGFGQSSFGFGNTIDTVAVGGGVSRLIVEKTVIDTGGLSDLKMNYKLVPFLKNTHAINKSSYRSMSNRITVTQDMSDQSLVSIQRSFFRVLLFSQKTQRLLKLVKVQFTSTFSLAFVKENIDIDHGAFFINNFGIATEFGEFGVVDLRSVQRVERGKVAVASKGGKGFKDFFKFLELRHIVRVYFDI